MRIYDKEEPKKERWDSSQAILHRESLENQNSRENTERSILSRKDGADRGLRENGGNDRDEKAYSTKNSFGKLDYLKKGKKPGQDKEGLSLEAFEAPGTPLHTDKEKHLDRSSMKKISNGQRKKMYASEVPFHNQAFFYEMSGAKKSSAFLKCMKMLIHQQGHQTLKDAFGFLDQEGEREELKRLKESQNELLPEEFDQENKRIDALNSRLLRKEAKERKLCNELQTMLDERTRKGYGEGEVRQALEETDKQEHDRKHKGEDVSPRGRLQPEGMPAAGMEETENPEDGEEEKDT